MLALTLAAFAGLAAAQQCMPDPANHNCSTPDVSMCSDTCSLYRNEGPCKRGAGCQWDSDEGCTPVDVSKAGECQATTTSTECSAVTGCTWLTFPCQSTQVCASTAQGISCTPTFDEAACTSQGPSCNMTDVCIQTTRCGMHTFNQAACIATSGCYYFEAMVLESGVFSHNSSLCLPCFNAPDDTENEFTSAQAGLGFACTNFANFTTIMTKVVASSMGCSGGMPTPVENDTTCVSLTSMPPTAGNSPTSPTPMDDDNNTDTNSTGKVTSSAVALFSASWAVLGAFFFFLA